MVRNRIVIAGALLVGAACTTVQKIQPAEFIPQHKPETVWVTYTDNSYVPVAHPQVTGDTLKGMWEGLGEPVSIPFNQIQSVQARVSSPKRTVILVTSLTLVTGAVIYTFATSGNSGGPPCLDHNGQPCNFCPC